MNTVVERAAAPHVIPTATSVGSDVDADEAARLAALHALGIVDSPPEPLYDDIVALAAQICEAPVALVSLVDRHRQWFKARIGVGTCETDRELSFCAHAIGTPDRLLVVEDATRDPRFAANPLVTGEMHVRFYAGAPIVAPDGHALGTVCVIDTVPRKLGEPQRRALLALAQQTQVLLALRQRTLATEQFAHELERLTAEAGEERRRSAELLEIVLRGGNLGLWDLDVRTGDFMINQREHAMLGYSEQDASPAALDWRSLVHPDDWPDLNAALAGHLRGDAAFYECEHRMRCKDGSWLWVLAKAVAVKRDADGTPLRIVGTHCDISDRREAQQALESATELLQRTGALAGVGGWEVDVETGRVRWTDEVYRIHDLEPGVELDIEHAIDYYAPEARPVIRNAVDAAMRDGTPWDLELLLITAKGRRVTVRAQGEAVRRDGKVVKLCGAFQDITERKRAEAGIADSERRLRMVTDNVSALIFYVDREERYRFANGQATRAFGIDAEEALGRTIREVRGETTYERLAPHVAAALGGEAVQFEYDTQFGDVDVHCRSEYVPDVDAQGQVQGFYAITFDITELHETQRQLERLARVDALTGLPNRRQFDDRLGEAMRRTRRTARAMALMFLDIDHFKAINDTHGHAAGDEVLCEFARRLKSVVRVTDLVARLAGDEFVVVLDGIDGVLSVARVAEKVVAAIRPLIVVGDAKLSVTTSVGVTVYRGKDQAAADLLSLADAALYQAKKQGRNRYAMA